MFNKKDKTKDVQNKSKKVKSKEVKKSEKKLNKSIKKQKKEKVKTKIPKTVQDTIPYFAVYEDEGIIETSPGVFTKSYILQDINYQIAKQQEQEEMFLRYGDFLNSFDSTIKFQITINNKNVNQEDFEANTFLKMQNDEHDIYREEYNKMLKKKMTEGKNNLARDKYLTVSVNANSYSAAAGIFARLDGEIYSNVKRIGQSETRVLTTYERLEILHDIYNLGSEGEFGKKAIIKGLEVEGFTLKNMRKLGLSTKDCIGPMSFKFEKDYMMIGDKYARALFLSDLPTFLTDNILAELTNTDCNMLTTLNYESIQQDKALRIVQNQMININANVIDKQKRASKAGYSTDLISPELTKAQSEANELLQDLTSKNQKMFLLTIVIVHFADTLEELNKHTEIISSTARKFICRVRVLHYQQENGLNSALPLCNNQLHIKRTLTTESTSIFMPFSSQELMQKEGLYYGLNAVSRNLILLNRKASKNANGFILGTPGSGKSFSAKREMLNVLLNTNDDVIVIDPEREYGPMAEMLGGEVVRIAAGSKYHLNPMDLDSDYADEDDPITLKSDFILSLCESVVGGRYGLDPIQRSIIDRCCRLVYAEYVQDFNPAKLPTLLDFQNLLEAQPEREAREIAIALEIYTRGSLDIFAHHTNVNNTGRFVIYDIKDIGNNIKTMAMLIVLDSIWNRIIQNRKKGKRTWFYIDEIYLLFTNETSATFLQQLYKRARKWGGVPTGITQNVEDLLRSETARTMLSNCEFIQMLNQAPLDRAELAHLLNISNTQLSYITNSASGEGLIYTGSSIVPFVDKFPTDTLMYKAMTTKVDEMKKEFR